MSILDKIYLNHMIAASVAYSNSQREAMDKFNHKLSECIDYYVATHKIQEGSYMMSYLKDTFMPLIKSIAKERIKNITII